MSDEEFVEYLKKLGNVICKLYCPQTTDTYFYIEWMVLIMITNDAMYRGNPGTDSVGPRDDETFPPPAQSGLYHDGRLQVLVSFLE